MDFQRRSRGRELPIKPLKWPNHARKGLIITTKVVHMATWHRRNDLEYCGLMRKWCIIASVELQRAVPMSRQSISFTDPNSEWLDRKVNVEHEYRSNSEAVNDLIRKAREIEAIRAQLIHAEQSGFTDLSREEIRAEIRKEFRRSGEL
jgi:antitoxin ParD1/3/4